MIMKPEEIKDLKIDKKYRFYFKNGTVIEARGIALLQIKNGIYVINTDKARKIYKIEEI